MPGEHRTDRLQMMYGYKKIRAAFPKSISYFSAPWILFSSASVSVDGATPSADPRF